MLFVRLQLFWLFQCHCFLDGSNPVSYTHLSLLLLPVLSFCFAWQAFQSMRAAREAKRAAMRSVQTAKQSKKTVIRTVCTPRRDNIIVFSPGYSMYEVSGRVNDVEVRCLELDEEFQPGWNMLLDSVDQFTKMIFFCTPNNPVGNVIPLERIREVASRFDGIIVVDEAYIDFTDMPSAVTLQKTYQNVVVLQTLSKAWGLAGLRVGICVADPELVIYLNKVKPPYNIGSLTQRRALDVLRNDADFLEKVETIKQERKRVTGVLRNLFWLEVVCDSEANFVLVRCERFRELYEYLVEGGVIVRVRHIPPRLSCGLRITVGTREENDLLIERLKKFGDL